MINTNSGKDSPEVREIRRLRRAVNSQTNQQSCCCLVVILVLVAIILGPMLSGLLLVLI